MILSGIDGANPLGYLAALGTLRLVGESNPSVKMRWVQDQFWRPEIVGLDEFDESSFCAMVVAEPPVPALNFIEALDDRNITVNATTFRRLVVKAAESAAFGDRRAADFAASFGSECCEDARKNRIEYTSFCFITGSGHQDFLETMRALTTKVSADDVRNALFSRWNYSDKGSSMRWDPTDAREYALRWDNPGPEGVWTVWGANRLAIEALPFFPSFQTGRHLETTGFRDAPPWEEFTWPVWGALISCDTVRSLVALSELQMERPDRQRLEAMGVVEVYRAQRIRIGAGANFKVSFRRSRSV